MIRTMTVPISFISATAAVVFVTDMFNVVSRPSWLCRAAKLGTWKLLEVLSMAPVFACILH